MHAKNTLFPDYGDTFSSAMLNHTRMTDWERVKVATAVKAACGRSNITQVTQIECKKVGTRTMSALTYIVLIVFAIFGIQYWLKSKSYIFDAEDIAKIAKRHVGNGKF